MKTNENIVVRELDVREILQPSKQENYDYVINPYTGCPNPCRYCYASFMRRFSRHSEEWGKFVDIKIWKGNFDSKKLDGKRILISSVTEPYNMYEKKYKVTRELLKKLVGIDCHICINTKSQLITRDIDILKKFKDVTVSLSICSLDQKFVQDIEPSYDAQERLKAIQKLHKEGIKVCVNVAPVFPVLTDWKEIINETKNYADEYVFESLTLRNEFKPAILNYIWSKHKDLYPTYYEIYKEAKTSAYERTMEEIDEFCDEKGLKHTISFKIQ